MGGQKLEYMPWSEAVEPAKVTNQHCWHQTWE